MREINRERERERQGVREISGQTSFLLTSK